MNTATPKPVSVEVVRQLGAMQNNIVVGQLIEYINTTLLDPDNQDRLFKIPYSGVGDNPNKGVIIDLEDLQDVIDAPLTDDLLMEVVNLYTQSGSEHGGTSGWTIYDGRGEKTPMLLFKP